MACLTLKVAIVHQLNPLAEKIAGLGPLWRPFSSGLCFYNGRLLFLYCRLHLCWLICFIRLQKGQVAQANRNANAVLFSKHFFDF